ncbi:MAG: hypothetical protein SFU86_13010 [Pirellulaceae bacterium]|nr:hypothetical protein [Pirellulaceae bacterium]
MFKRLAIFAFLACAASPAYGQLDKVFSNKGGQPVQGTVTAITKDVVTVDMGGVPRQFQVNEIARITFADEPNELNNARNAVAQQNYNLALTELGKIAAPSTTAINSDIAYYKALCGARLAMTEGGNKAQAATDLLNWVRGNANSHHFYEAAEILGDLAIADGKFADAAKYYKGLAAAPWADYQMRANNSVARALVAQKDFAGALQSYEAVLSNPQTSAEANQQKLLAAVGKGLCLGETGQPDQGVAMLLDIIAKNDPQDTQLFARCYNALGNCYIKLNKPKDALQAFLHTDILFYADADCHAEALYRLSKLWNDVNKSDRAVAARNTLRDRYPGTIWNTLE